MRKHPLKSISIFVYLSTVLLTASCFAGGFEEYDPCKEKVEKAKQEACPPVKFDDLEEACADVCVDKCQPCDPKVIEKIIEKPVTVEKIVERPVEKVVEKIKEVEIPIYRDVEVVVYQPTILRHEFHVLVGYGPDGIEAGPLYYDDYYRNAKTHYNVVTTFGYGYQFGQHAGVIIQGSTNRTFSGGLKVSFNSFSELFKK